jgi:hypothetical protein
MLQPWNDATDTWASCPRNQPNGVKLERPGLHQLLQPDGPAFTIDVSSSMSACRRAEYGWASSPIHDGYFGRPSTTVAVRLRSALPCTTRPSATIQPCTTTRACRASVTSRITRTMRRRRLQQRGVRVEERVSTDPAPLPRRATPGPACQQPPLPLSAVDVAGECGQVWTSPACVTSATERRPLNDSGT